MEESYLIDMCKQGYKECYGELIEKYEDTLYKYCFHLTRSENDAKDLFQNTWLKAMKNIQKYSDQYKFKNWILAIATNIYKDTYRKKKRWGSKIKEFFNGESMNKELNSLPSQLDAPEEVAIKKDRDRKLKELVNNLKEHYKVVVILFYFQEKTIKEISYILDIPEGTVKSRLNNAKKILKEKMEEGEYEKSRGFS